IVVQLLCGFVAITGLALPEAYEQFLDKLAFIADFTIMMGCIADLDFYDKLLATTLAPLMYIALVGCSWLAAQHCVRRARLDAGETAAQLADLDALRRHWTLFLGILFLNFGSVSSVVFRTFACEHFEELGEWYLRADYSIQCFANGYWWYAAYAFCAMLVYPIGIPALFAVLVWQKRKLRRCKANLLVPATQDSTGSPSRSDRLFEASGFLWEQYKTQAEYWKVFECARRLLLTGFIAFLLPGEAGQAAISMLLSFTLLLAFMIARPHRERQVHWQYLLGAVIIYLSTAAALLISLRLDYSNEPSSRRVVGWLLVALNVALITAAVFQTLVSVAKPG
ncbi:hypothetical protein JKP88DRAFT_151331, partial [Tribonema minus]